MTALPFPDVKPLTAVPDPVATLVIEVPIAELLWPVGDVKLKLFVILKQPLFPPFEDEQVLLRSGTVIASARFACAVITTPMAAHAPTIRRAL